MYLLPIAVIGLFAAEIAAAPLSSSHVVHERRDVVPKAWIKRDRIDGAIELPIRIGMTQSNLDKGHDLLLEV